MGDAWDLVAHLVGDDRGELLLVLHAGDGGEVVFPDDRVDFDDAVDGEDFFRDGCEALTFDVDRMMAVIMVQDSFPVSVL